LAKGKKGEEKAANEESLWQLDGKKISISSFKIINGFVKIDQNTLPANQQYVTVFWMFFVQLHIAAG
jgi:hypothetical protein